MRNPMEQLAERYGVTTDELLDRWQLCFYRDQILWFTDNFKNQWGDDWNDAPYDCNAEPPYEIYDERLKNEHRGHLVKVAVDFDGNVYDETPQGDYVTVEEINAGRRPWMTIRQWVEGSDTPRYYHLHGGDALRCVLDTLETAGVDCGVLARNFTMRV